MVTRTRRAALRDRTPVANTPVQSASKTKGPVKGKVKNSSTKKVSKKRKPTPAPKDVEIEGAPIVEDQRTRTLDETEKSQEEFSIGGFSFEDSQQSGVGLPGLGLGESVILQSTPAPSWRRRKQTTGRAPKQSRSVSILKQPSGPKASSPLPPSSPIPTSPIPSSRPVVQEPEPDLEFVEGAPSEHLSDDPFGFLSAERKLRAKKGQPKRHNKGKAVDGSTPTPEPQLEPVYDDDDDDNGIEDLYASEGEAQPPRRYQTPPPRQPSPHSERSSSLTSIQSPHTPSTPNKRNSNKRKLTSSRDSSPEPSAAPTSPSPSKPKVHSKPSAGETEGKTRGRTRKKRKSEEMKEEEGYDEEMDPSQIAEHLEALLPKSKKRTKAQAKGTRQSTRKITRRGKAPTPSSEDEEDLSPPRRPSSKRGGRKPASRTGKAKKNKEEGEEDVDLDELEVRILFSNFVTLSTSTPACLTESASRTA